MPGGEKTFSVAKWFKDVKYEKKDELIEKTTKPPSGRTRTQWKRSAVKL